MVTKKTPKVVQEQLCTWSGESYSVLHYPGCCIYYSG